MLKPDEHHELYQLGTILSNLGDYRGAIVDYNTAIESNPPHAGSYYLRGLEKIKIKDFQGAPDNFNKLIEIDPDYKNAYLNRAYIKLITDDYQGAIADFKKVGITTPLSFFEERNMQMVNNQQEITTVKVATLYCDNISSLEALAKQVRKMKIYDIYDY